MSEHILYSQKYHSFSINDFVLSDLLRVEVSYPRMHFMTTCQVC